MDHGSARYCSRYGSLREAPVSKVTSAAPDNWELITSRQQNLSFMQLENIFWKMKGNRWRARKGFFFSPLSNKICLFTQKVQIVLSRSINPTASVPAVVSHGFSNCGVVFILSDKKNKKTKQNMHLINFAQEAAVYLCSPFLLATVLWCQSKEK